MIGPSIAFSFFPFLPPNPFPTGQRQHGDNESMIIQSIRSEGQTKLTMEISGHNFPRECIQDARLLAVIANS